MKLYLQQDNHPWQPERYHYCAEQMMLTLFPEERPEYPQQLPPTLTGADSWAVLALHRGQLNTTLTAQVAWQGQVGAAEIQFPSVELDAPPQQVYHSIQHALKQAFYGAGIQVLGYQPPWGSLTGVRPVKLPTRSLLAGATPQAAKVALEAEYHVAPLRAQLAVDCATASVAVGHTLAADEVSVYIGIPFCPTRCAYCSFVSADVGRTLNLVEPYLQALLQEVAATAEALTQAGLHIRSFYMGGGTPTTLSPQQLDRLLTVCKATLPLSRCTEYTVEAGRPDTITREKLAVLAHHQIGRISINPQTLEAGALFAIGRSHTIEQFQSAYDLARAVGFACINMDLIAGLPQDSFAGFSRSLHKVLDMAPENITIHTLALKKGSALLAARASLPSGDEVAQMLDHSLATLSGAGYAPYYLYRQKYMSGALENVGWSVAGQESVYNIVMMEELQSVISMGCGGVTKLIDPTSAQLIRLSNPKYPHEYLSGFEKVLAQKQKIVAFYAP